MSRDDIFATHALSMFMQHESHDDGYELTYEIMEYAGEKYCVFKANNFAGKIVGVAIDTGNSKAAILDEDKWPVNVVVEQYDWETYMDGNQA